MLEALGYIGMIVTLSSVISANSKGNFRKLYNVLVIIGGSCLMFNAFYIGSVPFVILNFVWICLGSWGLYKQRR